MHELFAPQGSNPLTTVKVGNPRCTKVEFDRTVRSNVLVIEGDLTQSRVQIPKEDRAAPSLQLNHSLLIVQILIPSSGQFLLELNVSHSQQTKMRLSAATFVSRADVVDAKGMAHAKIPLVIPRNCWVQIVFHVGGIFSHLFHLPHVKWIDSVLLAGSCRIRKILTCAEEATAIETKPPGMLLFAVPAYGPPVWQTAVDQKQSDLPPPSAEKLSPPPSKANEVSARTVVRETKQNHQRTSVEMSNNTFPLEAQTARLPQSVEPSLTSSAESTSPPSLSVPSSATPVVSSPLRMKFLRGEDGSVTFTAKNPEAEAAAERQRVDMLERLRIEAEIVRAREEQETRRREKKALEDQQGYYLRLVDDENPGTGALSGRRTTNTGSAVTGKNKSPPPLTIQRNGASRPDQDEVLGSWDDEVPAPAQLVTSPTTGKSAATGRVPRRVLSVRSKEEKRTPLPKVTQQMPSMLMLSIRQAPDIVHPADDYDPENFRKDEPDVGYGCGFMEVLHGDEDEDDEYLDE